MSTCAYCAARKTVVQCICHEFLLYEVHQVHLLARLEREGLEPAFVTNYLRLVTGTGSKREPVSFIPPRRVGNESGKQHIQTEYYIMSARILSESSALSLTSELPPGTVIFRTKRLIPGDQPLSRKKGGTIAWIGIGGKPFMCHRQHGRWFISEQALKLLDGLLLEQGQDRETGGIPPTWEASASSPGMSQEPGSDLFSRGEGLCPA